jgi:hypothetical protein
MHNIQWPFRGDVLEKPMARTKSSNAKKNGGGANLGFEEKRWAAADKMRGHMDAAEYKHVALGLIFLKYISNAFQERCEALYFLNVHCERLGCRVPARLLLLYFTGDLNGLRRKCPRDEDGWRPSIRQQAGYVGLLNRHRLYGLVQELFLPVLVKPGAIRP